MLQIITLKCSARQNLDFRTFQKLLVSTFDRVPIHKKCTQNESQSLWMCKTFQGLKLSQNVCDTRNQNIYHLKCPETIFLLICDLWCVWFNLNSAQNTGVYNSSGFSCSLEASWSLESYALTIFGLSCFIIKPARSAGFSRIKKIPYQAPPTQLGPQKCTF